MTAQTQVPEQLARPAQPMREREARYAAGLTLILINIVVLAAAGILFWQAAVHKGGAAAAFAVPAILLAIVFFLVFRGIIVVAPGRAHVVQLFGQYKGTVRQPGLQWVNPFSNRILVSTRIRNMETTQAKVNDADGNPIEIAAVVVWQVEDTAQAIYSVDDYLDVRRDPGGDRRPAHRLQLPLRRQGRRGRALAAGQRRRDHRQLSAELADRVRAAGVQVIETRLTRLSYAAEIAGAMLRQQQAAAVVGARAKIVEGAVGMVRMALQRLDEENVVELDEERKAAMVSNLLVVLCSEQATQQVVNTGSLYA